MNRDESSNQESDINKIGQEKDGFSKNSNLSQQPRGMATNIRRPFSPYDTYTSMAMNFPSVNRSFWYYFGTALPVSVISKFVSSPLELLSFIFKGGNLPHSVGGQPFIQSNPSVKGYDALLLFWSDRRPIARIISHTIARTLSYTPINAIYFACYEYIQNWKILPRPKSSPFECISSYFLAGGAAGMTVFLVTRPFNVVGEAMKRDIAFSLRFNQPRQYHGFFDCMRKLRKSRGIFAFYERIGIMLPNVVLHRAFYFGGYQLGKFYILGEDNSKIVSLINHKYQSFAEIPNYRNFEITSLSQESLFVRYLWAQTLCTTLSFLFFPFATLDRFLSSQIDIQKLSTVPPTSQSNPLNFKNNPPPNPPPNPPNPPPNPPKKVTTWEAIKILGPKKLFFGFKFPIVGSVANALCLVLYDEILSR